MRERGSEQPTQHRNQPLKDGAKELFLALQSEDREKKGHHNQSQQQGRLGRQHAIIQSCI